MMKELFLLLIFITAIGNAQAQQTQLKIGDSAPEIKLLTATNDSITLSSLKGTVVLIDFWATWCAPCIKEQPELKSLYSRLEKQVKEGKFEIMGVSLDRRKDSWLEAIKQLRIEWLQVSDLKFWRSPVAKNYNLQELPFNIIVNEKGKIIALNLHGKELEAFIVNYFESNE